MAIRPRSHRRIGAVELASLRQRARNLLAAAIAASALEPLERIHYSVGALSVCTVGLSRQRRRRCVKQRESKKSNSGGFFAAAAISRVARNRRAGQSKVYRSGAFRTPANSIDRPRECRDVELGKIMMILREPRRGHRSRRARACAIPSTRAHLKLAARRYTQADSDTLKRAHKVD